MTQNGQENAAAYASGSVTDQSRFVPTSEAERTVARAAAFLDSRDDFPDDWRDRIDVDSLQLFSTCRCICGQAGGFNVDIGSDAWVDAFAASRSFWGAIDDAWSREAAASGMGRGAFGWNAIGDTIAAKQFEEAWKVYVTATRGQANTETSSDLGAKPNNPTSPPTTCGQTRTRSPEVLERVTANV